MINGLFPSSSQPGFYDNVPFLIVFDINIFIGYARYFYNSGKLFNIVSRSLLTRTVKLKPIFGLVINVLSFIWDFLFPVCNTLLYVEFLVLLLCRIIVISVTFIVVIISSLLHLFYLLLVKTTLNSL